jgi:hypothetical protein
MMLGTHTGRLAGVRCDGRMDVKTRAGNRITAPWHRFTRLQATDGYEYSVGRAQ